MNLRTNHKEESYISFVNERNEDLAIIYKAITTKERQPSAPQLELLDHLTDAKHSIETLVGHTISWATFETLFNEIHAFIHQRLNSSSPKFIHESIYVRDLAVHTNFCSFLKIDMCEAVIISLLKRSKKEMQDEINKVAESFPKHTQERNWKEILEKYTVA